MRDSNLPICDISSPVDEFGWVPREFLPMVLEYISMSQIFTAVIKQTDGWWVGWIEEVPGVNCQEASRAELLETLALTLREALVFNRQEALAYAGSHYHEERIAL